MATTDTGVTYLSADKTAIWLIQNQDTMGRALSKKEKEQIATYKARPASERAAIELAHLGHQLGAGVAEGAAPKADTTTTTAATATPTTTTTTRDFFTEFVSKPGEPSPPVTTGPALAGDTTQYTEEQQWDYEDYLALLQTARGTRLPTPKDIADYLANEAAWMKLFTEQEREFATYKKYASAYGTPDDWYALNIDDFYTNYTQAHQQLSTWLEEAGVAEEVREAYDEYALPPEEAARRREEAYGESRYAAEERYREQPMYAETFAQWGEEQTKASSALQSYIEREYPSLQAEYKAGVGPLTGYPTREAARAEATKREGGFEAWMTERLPETTQEYYMQRPYERGERYQAYSPTHRTVNW